MRTFKDPRDPAYEEDLLCESCGLVIPKGDDLYTINHKELYHINCAKELIEDTFALLGHINNKLVEDILSAYTYEY